MLSLDEEEVIAFERGRRERPVMDGFESLVAIPAREDLNRAYTRQFRSKVLGESVE